MREAKKMKIAGEIRNCKEWLKYSPHLLLSVLVILFLHGCSTIRPPRNARKIRKKMVITAYCKCGKCCSWKRTWLLKAVHSSGPNKGKRKEVGITASGSRAKRGTIAADTTLYPFGTVMYVPGYGYGRVEDRGGKIKGNHIDLFFNSHAHALEWGKQERMVSIWRGE